MTIPDQLVPDPLVRKEFNVGPVTLWRWDHSPTRRIVARERRTAAVHEAGHAVVARRYGMRSSARIFPNVGADPQGWERTWLGQSECFGQTQSEHRRKVIAFAGAVAECCWYRDPIDHSSMWEDPDRMSPSDWALAGCAPGEPDRACLLAAEKAESLLSGRLWPQLVTTARALIVKGMWASGSSDFRRRGR